MKILKSVFAVLFVATLFSSCAEEYVVPEADKVDTYIDGIATDHETHLVPPPIKN